MGRKTIFKVVRIILILTLLIVVAFPFLLISFVLGFIMWVGFTEPEPMSITDLEIFFEHNSEKLKELSNICENHAVIKIIDFDQEDIEYWMDILSTPINENKIRSIKSSMREIPISTIECNRFERNNRLQLGSVSFIIRATGFAFGGTIAKIGYEVIPEIKDGKTLDPLANFQWEIKLLNQEGWYAYTASN